MNFPLGNPIYAFLYWFVNTPGVGGLGVVALLVTSLGCFAGALRWIARGAQVDEPVAYAFPTSAFHEPHSLVEKERTHGASA